MLGSTEGSARKTFHKNNINTKNVEKRKELVPYHNEVKYNVQAQ